MDRPRSPRQRRRDPERTGPIRNAAGAWREGEPWREPGGQGGDAASRGVRAGYRVIDEQIRRGRRTAEELDEEDRNGRSYRESRRPRAGRQEGEGGFPGLAAQLRRTERLVQEMLRQVASARPDLGRLAELVFRLCVESLSDLAVLGFGAMSTLAPRWATPVDPFEEDVDRIERDFEESFAALDDEEPWDEPQEWPAAPSVPTVIRSTIPIPVCVWSHERTEVDLDLPAGAQSLDLEVERLLPTDTEEPAFRAEIVALAGGPVLLRIEVPRDLPAGRYRRRVLVRATGEPVGSLTVQVGGVPIVPVPPAAAAPKKRTKQ